MNTTQKRRFKRLIKFLEELPKKKFQFSQVYYFSEEKESKCPTVGCAIGWCPVVFPTLIKYSTGEDREMHQELIIGNKRYGYSKAASKLFGLPRILCVHLFSPMEQSDIHDSLNDLGSDSTPKQAAREFKKFLKLYEDGEIDTTFIK